MNRGVGGGGPGKIESEIERPGANLQQKGEEKAKPMLICVRPPCQQVGIAAPSCPPEIHRWNYSLKTLVEPNIATLVNLKVENLFVDSG